MSDAASYRELFVRFLGREYTVKSPEDGGEVIPAAIKEQQAEMDAKWERGEYPIQQIVRDDRLTGYATENVTQPTDDEQAAMAAWIYAIEWATRDNETWTA